MQGILRKVFRYKLISVFFIVSQLVMFYSVFGALSIYNKAYAKEQDRIDSLYKNDIEMNITTGNANDMFKYVANGADAGNLTVCGKLSLAYAEIGRNTKCEVIIKENESFPYQMVNGHIPGTLEEDEGKNIVAVGRYKYKDSYEKDGKRYVTIENEPYEVCGIIGSENSDYWDYTMVFNMKCIGENTLNKIISKGTYTFQLASNTEALDDSYANVYGNIKSVDKTAQISAQKMNLTGNGDMLKDISGEEMNTNIIIYIFCILNCLLISEFLFIQKKKEIAIKKIYGMSNLRIIDDISVNILFLCLTALIIFILSAFIINVLIMRTNFIEINLTGVLVMFAAIIIAIAFFMGYPVVKILRKDSLYIVGKTE